MYDPATDRWVTTNPMTQGRVSHTATLLPDGRVLVAGGRNAQTNGKALDTTEIFDANAQVAISPAATPAVSSSPTATSPQSLASRPSTMPLLAGGIALIVIALLTLVLIRRRGNTRPRSGLR